MKALLKHLLLIVVFTGVVSCQPHDMKKAMIHFDQAFIPVMMAACDGDIYKAKSAVFYLEFQWQKLNNQYGKLLPRNEDWMESFRRVNAWLGDAYYAIDNNDPKLAINQLEHVKYELMELRRVHGIDYYLDDLFDLQITTDQIVRTANDDRLKLLEWNEFEKLLIAAAADWKAIMAEPIDFQIYEFNKGKTTLFNKYQNELSQIFNGLTEGMECADQAMVAQQVNALDPALRQMISLFGSFEGDRTYFANNLDL